MKFKLWYFALSFNLIVALLSFIYMSTNNTYTQEYQVPVTFIDKSGANECHKKNCRREFLGLFKRDSDGWIFERPITFGMYSQTPLGERFSLELSKQDMKDREGVSWVEMDEGFIVLLAWVALSLIFWCVWIIIRFDNDDD